MRQVLGAGALGRPRGMGGRGRWDGGSGWGTHVNPWLIHVNVWQKLLQYCKVISLQLLKINEKKKMSRDHFWSGNCFLLVISVYDKIRTAIVRKVSGSLMTTWHCPDNQVGARWLVSLHRPVCGLLHSLASCMCHELGVVLA